MIRSILVVITTLSLRLLSAYCAQEQSGNVERLHQACRQEIRLDYVRRQILQVTAEVPIVGTSASRDAYLSSKDEAQAVRKEICDGAITICCGDELVAQTKGEAIVEAAKILLEMARGYTEGPQKAIDISRKEGHWEDNFNRLCVLEHKTGAKQKFYRVSEKILRPISLQASRDARILGDVLDMSCPLAPKYLEPTNDAGPMPEANLKCKDEVRSRVVCQALNEVTPDHLNKYHELELEKARVMWCEKSQKLQEARESKQKLLKCTDKQIDALTNEAKVIAEILLELLELEKTSELAQRLNGELVEGLKAEINTLSKIKVLYRKQIADQRDSLKKSQEQAALKLITGRIDELKSRRELKNSKLEKLLNPNAWSNLMMLLDRS